MWMSDMNHWSRQRRELHMIDPLEIRMLVLPLEDVIFPGPGEYRVQLASGDAPLMERRLLLTPPGETIG